MDNAEPKRGWLAIRSDGAKQKIPRRTSCLRQYEK